MAALSGQAASEVAEGAPAKDGRGRPNETGSTRKRPEHAFEGAGRPEGQVAGVPAPGAANLASAPGTPGEAAAGTSGPTLGRPPKEAHDGQAKTLFEPAGPGPAGIVLTRPELGSAPTFGAFLTAQLAPAASDGASPNAPAPGQVLMDVPVGRVPIEIGLKSLEGVNRFEMRLTPDDLGRVDVRLDIQSDGQVKAHLIVERPETLLLLTRDQGHLERALEQAGFKPSDTGVGFSLRDGTADGGGGRGHSNADGQSQGRPVLFEEARPGLRGSGLDVPAVLRSRRATGIDVRI